MAVRPRDVALGPRAREPRRGRPESVTERDALSARERVALSARGLVAAASWMSGAHLVAQAFAYSSLIVLARLLPPGSFGTAATGTALVWMAIVVMGAGTHGSIVTSPRLSHAFLRGAFRRCLVAAVGLAAAMAIGADALVGAVAKGGDAAAMAVLALSLPLYAVAIIPMAVLQRAMEFAKLARLTAAANVGSAGVAVAAGFAGAGVWALVARQLLWFGLLATLAAALARRYLPRRSRVEASIDEQASARPDGRWFLLFGATLLVTMNLDYLVIGGMTDVGAVGLYALAFLIAFAPLEHFSSEVGKVLFAAAAATDLRASGARTVRAVRLMSFLLLPLLPAAIALAPVLLPAVVGSKWSSMVGPFQVLLVVGIGYAIVNCVGEALSGVGEIAFRAKVNVGWCGATLVALLVLVPIDGIRGAALAHLAVFVPYAAVYATAGARRAGTATGELWGALRPIVLAVGWQAVVTAGFAIGSRAAGAGEGVAACAGAMAGLLALTAMLATGRLGLAAEAARPARGAMGGSA